jgi:hypothetical protein
VLSGSTEAKSSLARGAENRDLSGNRSGKRMKSFDGSNYQDRVGRAADAKQKALEQLRNRPAPDPEAAARRIEALEKREAARAEKAAAKARSESEAAEAAAAAQAVAAAAPTEDERKAARDARYAARKARR